MGLGTKEEVSRKIFSWRGHYLYAWAGRKDSGGKGKGEKKNVKFYNFLAFVFFYFLLLHKFVPVFFFNLAKFLYFSTKKLRFFIFIFRSVKG
jgi:hypothetical protein